jgi:hypothetical protein
MIASQRQVPAVIMSLTDVVSIESELLGIITFRSLAVRELSADPKITAFSKTDPRRAASNWIRSSDTARSTSVGDHGLIGMVETDDL